MASHHGHPHYCQHQADSPSTHCSCNPSYSCCTPAHHPTPPPPPSSRDQLVKSIASSILCQSDPIPTPIYTQCPKIQTQNLLNLNRYQQKYHPTHRLHRQEQQTHSTIASLLSRIDALESSLHHFSSRSYHSSCFLRDTAARIIQTHFRAFLVRRSRTLRQLKDLAFVKSRFNSLKSTFYNENHIDFAAFSRKAVDLLLILDSIEGGDPMIRDGKRSISKGLVQLLDFIEGVAVKKHWRYVKATGNARFGQNVYKSGVWESRYGNSGGDDQSKLLQNLRGRVDKISRLCKVSADDDKDAELESINHVADEDVGPSVLINRRNGVPQTTNGMLVRRQGVQPRVKKCVSFAENGNISKVYGSSTYEPALSGDVTCLDESSSSDELGGLLGTISCEAEDVMDSSRGVEDDEEALMENGGSPMAVIGKGPLERISKMMAEKK